MSIERGGKPQMRSRRQPPPARRSREGAGGCAPPALSSCAGAAHGRCRKKWRIISALRVLSWGEEGNTASQRPSNPITPFCRARQPPRVHHAAPQPGGAQPPPLRALPGRAKLAGAAAEPHLHLNRHPRGPAAAEIEQWPARAKNRSGLAGRLEPALMPLKIPQQTQLSGLCLSNRRHPPSLQRH